MKNSREIKNTHVIILAAVLIFSLCGCDVSIEETGVFNDSAISFENEIEVYDTTGSLIDTDLSVIEQAEEEDNEALLTADNLEEVKADVFDGGSSTYAYSHLEPSAQQTYREIHSILHDALEEVVLTCVDTEEIDLAFRAVMVDHPEIFYVNGYSLGKYMVNGEISKITFSGTYTMSKDEIDKKRTLVDQYVELALMQAPVSDDYEKIKYVYEYIIKNNTYNLLADNNQNILSVVEGGETVCQGYAKMMQLMLERLDIFCTLVNGLGKSGDSDDYTSHVWNIVKCNGEYYNLDATWGDSAFTLIDSEGGQVPEVDINYEYFLVPDKMMEGSHQPQPVVKMPECNTHKDNYYLREGLYFDSVDTEHLKNAFEREYSKGTRMMFIKASDGYVFDDLCRHLFDEQNVFDYMGQENVRYVAFKERNLIMISL